MEGAFYNGKPQIDPYQNQKEEKESENDDDDMSIEEGLDLPEQNQVKNLKMVNSIAKFQDYCNMMSDSCSKMIYNDTNTHLTFPTTKLHEKIIDKFPIVQPNIMMATTGGFEENVTNAVASQHIIATPVHISPTIVLLKRYHNEKKNVINGFHEKYSDSISVIRQLMFYRIYLNNVASANKDYNVKCSNAYKLIVKHIDDIFFQEMDDIIKKKNAQTIELEQVITLFGMHYEKWMVNKIRALEWTIADLLGVPVSLRGDLLTPNPPINASVLTMQQGEILRNNMTRYLRLRKQFYLQGSHTMQKNKKFINDIQNEDQMEVEDDNDNENRELMVDRLVVKDIELDWSNPTKKKFKGYICYTTLKYIMDFLEER